MFDKLKLTDHAKTAQYEVKDYMQDLGYKCHLEHKVNDRYDGRNGRIDIVCYKGNETVYKLEHFKATKKYVICRNGYVMEIKGDE